MLDTMVNTMYLPITNFNDLLNIIRTHPELRKELKKALLPELDAMFDEVKQALRELAEAQRRTEECLQQLTSRVGRLEVKVDRLEIKVDQLDTRLTRLEDRVERGFAEATADRNGMKHTIGILKGKTYERECCDKAAGVFGRYLKRGHDLSIELSDLLQEAENNGLITENEYDQVYAADLLWGGKLKTTDDDLVLVVEASWLALDTDVERTVTRSNILRKAGLKALPVVAAVEWEEATANTALAQKVVLVRDRNIDKSSWLAALSSLTLSN